VIFKPRLNEVDALRALRRISFSGGLQNRVGTGAEG
jgi:hypothetical protein